MISMLNDYGIHEFYHLILDKNIDMHFGVVCVKCCYDHLSPMGMEVLRNKIAV